MRGAIILLSVFLDMVCGKGNLTFPKGFLFGAATSAYQVEGSWNVDGKGESIWDRSKHRHPELVPDGANGDIACDSYRQYMTDVRIAEDLGLHFYRFSISWTRILPNGIPSKINAAGAKYYSDLIDALLDKGIEPIITMYHFDLPQRLQDLGGWTNPLIVDWFANYARTLYSLYADRVTTWLTINEPNIMCDFSFNSGIMAPHILEPEYAPYLCNKYVLLAHAKAWRIYDEEFKPKFHGKLSLSNFLVWMTPVTEADQDAADLANYHCNRYTYPVYSKEGGWPPSIQKALADYSKRRGYSTSVLPNFTKEEIEMIKGTYDFFSLNYYSARVVRWAKPGDEPGFWIQSGAPDLNLVLGGDPAWPTAGLLPSYPEGLRKVIAWVREEYGEQEIFVTENGFGKKGGDNLIDRDRIDYINKHLEQILLSIEDGANVTGYTVWALMDNFEWVAGYTLKFGLYEVNFTDPKRRRIPRASAYYFAELIKQNSLNVSLKPTMVYTKRHKSNGYRQTINNFVFVSIYLLCFMVNSRT
ncbi:myrosinase 1-like [Epargyreus clarus]|uniref:myrosinase 1-like n=1 Tax=Epargyreus clarus TaxID=520877 RepID=UPI003C2F816B